jgi:hypothetical protein
LTRSARRVVWLLCRPDSSKPRRQLSGTVMDRQRLHLVVTDQPVHDAVRPADEFTHRRVFELRNRPALFRKHSELFNSRDELTYGDRSVVCGVLTDEGVDGSEVGLGLVGPVDGSNGANRFFTSSCGMSWPASACLSPSSIFAIKHSRSIASSIVACSGRLWMASMARCFSVVSMVRS